MTGNVRPRLLTCGRRLEVATLGWHVAGIVVLAVAAVRARSVALAGFGLDSLIEIGTSTVVLCEWPTRPRNASAGLCADRAASVALVAYLTVQRRVVLAIGHHPHHSVVGIAWTAVTVAVMFALAAGKARTGAALDKHVLRTEGRVTSIDGIRASAVLAGLVLNASLGWFVGRPCRGLRAPGRLMLRSSTMDGHRVSLGSSLAAPLR